MSEKTYSLFLDDERYPPVSSSDNWVICRNYWEAQKMFKSCTPDRISFDHDLGYVDAQDEVSGSRRDISGFKSDMSGYDFAKWVVEYDMDNDVLTENFTFSVHSMNSVGSNNITEYMFSYLEFKFGPRRG